MVCDASIPIAIHILVAANNTPTIMCFVTSYTNWNRPLPSGFRFGRSNTHSITVSHEHQFVTNNYAYAYTRYTLHVLIVYVVRTFTIDRTSINLLRALVRCLQLPLYTCDIHHTTPATTKFCERVLRILARNTNANNNNSIPMALLLWIGWSLNQDWLGSRNGCGTAGSAAARVSVWYTVKTNKKNSGIR